MYRFVFWSDSWTWHLFRPLYRVALSFSSPPFLGLLSQSLSITLKPLDSLRALSKCQKIVVHLSALQTSRKDLPVPPQARFNSPISIAPRALSDLSKNTLGSTWPFQTPQESLWGLSGPFHRFSKYNFWLLGSLRPLQIVCHVKCF